jgi:hypothetical protein
MDAPRVPDGPVKKEGTKFRLLAYLVAKDERRASLFRQIDVSTVLCFLALDGWHSSCQSSG